MNKNWFVRKRPARLERKIEFSDYEETREFLERAAELSEREGYFPDMSFGRTHVSVTLEGEEGAEEVSAAVFRYADSMDALIEAPAVKH